MSGPVLIIGAGMGGLALAIALEQRGIATRVFEAAPKFLPLGAGLSVSPNATHALQSIGLGPFLQAQADRPREAVMLDYRDGRELSRNSMGDDLVARYGAEYYQIHRADMHDGLVQRLLALNPAALQLDRRLTALTQDGGQVRAQFAGGEAAEGQLLVGADGLRSTVRGIVAAPEAPQFTGQVAYRAVAPLAGLEDLLSEGASAVTVGPGHIFVRYPIRHGELLNLVAIARTDSWQEEGWTTPASIAEVQAQHEGWNDRVQALIQAMPADAWFKWALFDREPLAQWRDGGVTLLGDAAHPMLPFHGMGGAMAFEDAVVLARCLADDADWDRALDRYEAARRPRTRQVMLSSRAHGVRLQASGSDSSAWQDRIRAGGNEQEPESDWAFFGYNPVTVDL